MSVKSVWWSVTEGPENYRTIYVEGNDNYGLGTAFIPARHCIQENKRLVCVSVLYYVLELIKGGRVQIFGNDVNKSKF